MTLKLAPPTPGTVAHLFARYKNLSIASLSFTALSVIVITLCASINLNLWGNLAVSFIGMVIAWNIYTRLTLVSMQYREAGLHYRIGQSQSVSLIHAALDIRPEEPEPVSERLKKTLETAVLLSIPVTLIYTMAFLFSVSLVPTHYSDSVLAHLAHLALAVLAVIAPIIALMFVHIKLGIVTAYTRFKNYTKHASRLFTENTSTTDA